MPLQSAVLDRRIYHIATISMQAASKIEPEVDESDVAQHETANASFRADAPTMQVLSSAESMSTLVPLASAWNAEATAF